MIFYRLTVEEGKRRKYAWAFPPFETDDEIVECDFCGRKWNNCKKGFLNNTTYPITFSNNYFPDYLCCQAIRLVSQRMKEIIEKSGIQIAKFTEMPVVGKSEFTKEKLKELRDNGYNINKLHDEKPIYYRLGTDVGAVLHRDSNVIWVDEGEYVCKHCGYGVGYDQIDWFAPEYIQLDSWNGNDLFKVREFIGAFYCTERFKTLCAEAKFTGIEFSKVESR